MRDSKKNFANVTMLAAVTFLLVSVTYHVSSNVDHRMAGQVSGGLVGFLAGSVWKPLYTGLWVAVGFMWCSG